MRKVRGIGLAVRLTMCVVIGGIATVGLAYFFAVRDRGDDAYYSRLVKAAPWPRAVPGDWPASPELVSVTSTRGRCTVWASWAASPGRTHGHIVCVQSVGWPKFAFRDFMQGGPDGVVLSKGWTRVYGGWLLTPLWSGFALDTAFYAAIAFTLWSAPGAVRRHRRRARGLCTVCGYDLKGSPSRACPECGA